MKPINDGRLTKCRWCAWSIATNWLREDGKPGLQTAQIALEQHVNREHYPEKLAAMRKLRESLPLNRAHMELEGPDLAPSLTGGYRPAPKAAGRRWRNAP
jgi:hypothetical protein